jgi:hypothetical protein
MADSPAPVVDRRPWDRRANEGETSTAYERFVAYLELPPRRSLTKLAAALSESGSRSCSRGRLSEWSRKWGWVERAAAYDDYRLAKAMEGRERAQEEARQRAFNRLNYHMQLLEDIAVGKMPPGDREVVLDRQGRPMEMLTDEVDEDGKPIMEPVTRPVIPVGGRIKALVQLIGFGGVTVAKRTEVHVDGADEVRQRALTAMESLTVPQMLAMAAAFGVDDESL